MLLPSSTSLSRVLARGRHVRSRILTGWRVLARGRHVRSRILTGWRAGWRAAWSWLGYPATGRIFRLERLPWAYLSPEGWFRVEDLLRHVVLLGATGVGKTSTVLHTIVREATRRGVPLLVYGVKNTDAADFRRYIEAGGGRVFTVSIGKDGQPPPYVFPFFTYLDALGVGTLDIVELFITAMSAVDQGEETTEPHWDRMLRLVLINTITLMRGGGIPLTFENLSKAMVNLPFTGTDPKPFIKFMRPAIAAAKTSPEVNEALHYFKVEFRQLSEKAGPGIKSMWDVFAGQLKTTPLRQLFALPTGDQKVITPATVLDDQCSVIIDVPALVHPRAGKLFNTIFQACFALAVNLRSENAPVCAVVKDEFQASDPDASELKRMLATWRSANVGLVLATQSLRAAQSVYGDADADTIVGAPATFIACRSDDPTTQEYLVKKAGEKEVEVESETVGPQGERSTTTRTEMQPVLQTQDVATLMRPKKTQWRPRSKALVFRDGNVFEVKFDRLPPGWNRRLRGLMAGVLNVDARGWRGVLRRCGQAITVMASLSILAGVGLVVGLPIVMTVQPQIARDIEDWILALDRRQKAAASAKAVRPGVYVVRPSDTIGKIAQRFGVTVEALARVNDLPSIDNIEVGQRLRVPAQHDEDQASANSH